MSDTLKKLTHDQLHPADDNIRTEVGDVTSLADSIAGVAYQAATFDTEEHEEEEDDQELSEEERLEREQNERYDAALAEWETAVDAAMYEFVNASKPAELVKFALGVTIASSFEVQHHPQSVRALLSDEVDDLVEYAQQNASNLARVAAAVYVLRGKLPEGVLPERPEWDDVTSEDD